MNKIVSLDKIDHQIIRMLLDDGRVSFSTIAKEVKLTDVAIKKRIDGLIRKGVINSINANINLNVLGYQNPLFIQLRTETGKHKDLTKKLGSFDNVLELYHVIGEYNLLAKIVVPEISEAETFINKLGLLDGVLDIKTQLVINELKKTNALPTMPLQKKF
ncbi:MAG: Lrp/AsnC family transcriptional regulator [archaeon]|nr:Lrp/AsnC family transcriptional regulator [Candidatus Micrarchaeota archaeon]